MSRNKPSQQLKQGSGRSNHSNSSGSDHHVGGCYNITVDFFGILLAASEIGIVLYLSISHFSHSKGVIALAMLGPIFLNFIGVTYFLSNREERKVFEANSSKCAKDIFQMPVFGPVFTAIQVFMISTGISKSADYARFEALAIKLRQAESFFGAAPESLIQLTVLMVAEEHSETLTLNQYLEIVIVILSAITLAEANMYAFASNYYRLFHTFGPNDWKLPKYRFWQKAIMFFHAFFSIGSRIAAMACLKAAVKYVVLDHISNSKRQDPSVPIAEAEDSMRSNAEHVGYYLTVFFLLEIGIRIMFYYVARLIKFIIIGKGIPSGCYESINYGWRATILDFGFQSKNIAVQLWFYAENSICFIIWWVAVTHASSIRPAMNEIKNSLLLPLATIYVMFTLMSIFLLFACTGLKLHTLRSPFINSKGQSKIEP